MEKLIQNYSDETLISLWKKNYITQNKIQSYFYKKYMSVFRGLSYYYMKKVYSIAVDHHDLVSLSFFAIETSMKNYSIDINNKYSYFSYLKRTYTCMILDYLKKYMRKKHQILNKSLSIEKHNMNLISNDFKDDIYKKLLLEKIFGQYFNLTNEEKQILKMRIKLFKNKYISQKLKISEKKASRIFTDITKKIKQIV